MSIIMENIKYSDKLKIVKNKICHFTFHRTHNSNVHKTRCKHPQPLWIHIFFLLTFRETRVRVTAVMLSIPTSLFTFRSKYMFVMLLWYTGSSRKSENIWTGDVGGQYPFQVISLRQIPSALKNHVQAEWHAQPSCSIQQWSPNKKRSCTDYRLTRFSTDCSLKVS